MTTMTPSTVEEYLHAPYQRILTPEEEGGYSAEMLEFPGCFSEGESAQEAVENLEDAAAGWIQATLDQGRSIPEPFDNRGFSGNIALRLPRSIHRQAARLAERDNTSLNQFLVTCVAARIGAESVYAHLAQMICKDLVGLIHETWAKTPAISVVATIANTNIDNTVTIKLPEVMGTQSGIAATRETLPEAS